MKIGFSGLTATGKTSLIGALSEQLGWEIIHESIPRSIFQSRPGQLAEALLNFARRKREAIAKAENCLIDRTCVDIAMMVLNEPRIFDISMSVETLRECREMADEMDLLVLLPPEIISTAQRKNEAGLIRRFNPILRTKNNILMRGLAAEMMDSEKLRCLPQDCETLERRIAWVQEQLQ